MAKATHTPKTLTAAREALGLSVHAAAVEIGVDPIALRKAEAGARGCSVATLERIADYFGLTLTETMALCEAARAA